MWLHVVSDSSIQYPHIICEHPSIEDHRILTSYMSTPIFRITGLRVEHAGHVASDTSIQYPHIFPDVELITGATPCFRYQESSRVGRLGVRRYQIRQQIPGYIRAEAEDTPALILMSQHQAPVRLLLGRSNSLGFIS